MELLHLEASIKAEAVRKASIVKVDQFTSTEDNVKDNKTEESELDEQEKALHERIKAAEIQVGIKVGQ